MEKEKYIDNDFYWYWFVNIKGIGNAGRRKLMKRFMHPENLFRVKEREMRDLLNQQQLTYLMKSRNTYDVKLSIDRLKESGTRFVHWESADYPASLRQLYDAPYGFYLRGSLPRTDAPVLGMVGSRLATAYGLQIAEHFADVLAQKGIQIVSGLAAGIDAACHWGALRGGGYTLGILGGGIDSIYPRENFNLYMKMYERGGVLSEYNLGVANYAGLFPVRNRLISGIADAVFVLEAGEKSGSLITADQALEQGKDVFVLPGRITDRLSRGCNKLIAEGACLVQTPEDILQVLTEIKEKNSRINAGYRTNSRNADLKMTDRTLTFQNTEQKTIYALLDEKIPMSFNEILEKSKYNYVKLQYILLEMELSQWIYQPVQNSYLKKIL